jgi:hypothetical protein
MTIELRCPYCKQLIILNKFACNKMRHGIVKYENKLINPGMSDAMALNLARLGLIYGCGKKYKISVKMQKNGVQTYYAEKCQ